MKVTYNWLKDFVEIKISPQALAEKLTMAGLEVTALEEKEGDFVFEIEVTSNRPDWLSVIGIAREVAAILGCRCKLAGKRTKECPLPKTTNAQPFSVEIEDKNDCPLYTAKIIENVQVGPSVDWIKKRLELVGCRSVNNVVDITNYILFEWGEPLHAFDFDKLNQEAIIVRRGRPGEKITTIDGEEKALGPDVLVIADRQRPVAVAGVMGGKESEVTEASSRVLLEAAVFNPVVVRRAKQKLGIQSESAYRFERGVDLGIVEAAAWQAVKLIQELCAGNCVLARAVGSAKAKKRKVSLEVNATQKILGMGIEASKIKAILNRLSFKATSKTKNILNVEVPAHRQDVSAEIDLIEEVARIFGFERISTTLPKISPNLASSGGRDFVSLVKDILVGLGLNEIISYSLIDRNLADLPESNGKNSLVEILNPLSKEQEVLRQSILSGLCRAVAQNLNQKQSYINIFEVSKVFSSRDNSPKEELLLGLALCGTRSLLLKEGLIREQVSLLHLKGILEVIFERLGIKDYYFTSRDNPGCVAVYAKEEKIGTLLQLTENTLDKFEIKNKEVVIAEISLDKLLTFANLKKKLDALPKYPGILRDVSVILRQGLALEELLKAMLEKGRPFLREVKIIDYYKGKQIPSGFRGLTISCFYRSDERTLTEAEINPVHSLVSFLLADKFGAQIRRT